MKKDFETKVTGWAFILGALMLWLGWALSPHHIGEYIVASDFEAIGESVWTWIWIYRIHIFGWVTMGIALFALVAAMARKMSTKTLNRRLGEMSFRKFYKIIVIGDSGVGKTNLINRYCS